MLTQVIETPPDLEQLIIIYKLNSGPILSL
jgi:hypothetical protein